MSRIAGSLLLIAAAFLAPLSARAAVRLTGVDRTRLSNIEKIANAKSAGSEWRTLLSYLRSGPSSKVRFESANLLAQVSNARLKDELVKTASDTSFEPGTRFVAPIALKGSVAYVTDEDVERMLKSDEDMGPVFGGALDVASQADLSLKQVQAILERYDKRKPRIRGNRNVLIILFAGRHLKNHKSKSFVREIRPVLGRFLVERAHKAGPEPPNLRGYLGIAMADNHVRGAVAVFIESMRDGLHRQKAKHRPYRPTYEIKMVRKLTGASMGYDEKTMEPGDPETMSAVNRWLAWWEENKDNPRYRLPDLKPKTKSTVPAAGSRGKGP